MPTRQAQTSDFDRIAGIDDRCVYDACRRDLIRHAIEIGECWIVDTIRIGVIAFAIVTNVQREPSLRLIVVAPFARRRGIATALLDELEAHYNGKRFISHTRPTDQPMRQLLTKRGYAENPYTFWHPRTGPEILYIKQTNSA